MKNKKINLSFSVLLLSLFFGLLGGISGDLLARFYIFKDLDGLIVGEGELSLDSNFYNQPSVVIRDPKKVVVNQDLKIQETVNSANDNFIGFYKKLSLNQNSESLNDYKSYYNLNKPDFSGLVFTADGWIMVSGDSINPKILISDYLAITKNKKIYEVDRVVEYKNENLWFLHLKGVDNLSVKNLAAAESLTVGQLAIAVNWNNDVLVSTIESLPYRLEGLKSSDQLNEKIFLNEKLSNNFKNSWIFSLSGDLLALVDENLNINPVSNIRSAVYSFLNDETFSNSYLGVNYLSLSNLINPEMIDKSFMFQSENGALVYPNDKNISVVKSSPADKAGIKEGDIIVSINNTEINENNDLGRVIQSYKSGEIITVKFLRNNQIQTVDVKLESLNIQN